MAAAKELTELVDPHAAVAVKLNSAMQFKMVRVAGFMVVKLPYECGFCMQILTAS